MVRIILLKNVCGQHGPYYTIVEVCEQHDPYYIIEERMWTTWSVLFYCRTSVNNMIRIIVLLNECGQHDPYNIIVEHMWTTWSVLYY
jgi:hypothetical protein